MNSSLILTLQVLTCMTTLILGGFVVWQRPKRSASWHFLVFALGTSIWNFALFFAVSQFGQPTLWGRLAISFGSFMPAGFFIFLASLPPVDRRFKIERIIVMALSVFFFAISLTPLVVRRAWIVDHSYIAGDLGKWYFIFWVYYLSFLLLAFIKCSIKYRAARKTLYGDQLRYVLIGFLFFFVPLLVTQFILPLFGVFKYNNLGPLFALPMVAIISYAIVRHELLDIRIAIQRSLIWTILFAVLIVVYAGMIELTSYIVGDATGMSSGTSAAVTTIFGVFFFRPLEAYFRKITDPFFFKNPYDYAKALHTLNSTLYRSLSREDIIGHSEQVLKEIFKTDDVRFILDPTAADGLSDHQRSAGYATLLYPIAFEETTIGLLHLGPKRSGETYTKQDLQLVSTFALPAAIALGKARLHEEVRTYSSHLEELVEERTAELKKLQEEQKRHMIDISHNLQTPLAIIKGELELLGDNFADQDKVQTVSKSLDRVSGFIRQLLRIARLEKQSAEVEFADLDIAALLREQADYFEPVAEDKGARLFTNIPHTPVVVHGNRRLLGELFTNIVANALTYTSPSRKASIRITLSHDAKNAVVSIEDNGIGIAPEDMPELFNRFYRSPRVAHALSGSGLGLAIGKQIVDMHGGMIGAESTLDAGTTFTVSLPLA